jgi:AMMECR1 domain-containing protein
MRPGVDGIIFEYGEYRSTFLPQVWEQLPEPSSFLEQLRRKAGLRPGFWAPEVRLQRYTVVKWQENP